MKSPEAYISEKSFTPLESLVFSNRAGSNPSLFLTGFTLIELLLVLAILALLIILSLPLAINFYKTRQLDVYQNSVVQTLRRAQLKSMSIEADSAFGVYIAPEEYLLFRGNSYAGRQPAFDEIFDLPENLQTSGLSEIVFGKLTGLPSVTGDITLVIDGQSGIININETGRINY